jgi:hypothetical protein
VSVRELDPKRKHAAANASSRDRRARKHSMPRDLVYFGECLISALSGQKRKATRRRGCTCQLQAVSVIYRLALTLGSNGAVELRVCRNLECLAAFGFSRHRGTRAKISNGGYPCVSARS